MSEVSHSWLRWAFGMGERRRLGDVAMDVLLFAGVVNTFKRSAPLLSNTLLTRLVLDVGRHLCSKNFLEPDPQQSC